MLGYLSIIGSTLNHPVKTSLQQYLAPQQWKPDSQSFSFPLKFEGEMSREAAYFCRTILCVVWLKWQLSFVGLWGQPMNKTNCSYDRRWLFVLLKAFYMVTFLYHLFILKTNPTLNKRNITIEKFFIRNSHCGGRLALQIHFFV